MAETTAPAPAVSPEPQNRTAPRASVLISTGLTHLIETRYGVGSQAIPDLTLAVGDDRTASLIKRTIEASYVEAGRTVEQTRADVLDELRHAYADETAAWYRDGAYVRDLDRAMDIFTSPADRERLGELGRQVAAMAGAR